MDRRLAKGAKLFSLFMSACGVRHEGRQVMLKSEKVKVQNSIEHVILNSI
jgi:hypothetical protein